MRQFELVIVGGGPAGYVAAIRAAQRGMAVALVEENQRLGGTCLRVGCIPSKTLLESSRRYRQLDELDRHGITIAGKSLALERLLERQQQVTDTLAAGIARLMKKHGVEVFHARGRLAGGGRVDLEQKGRQLERLQAQRVLLATGSTPVAVPQFPCDGERVVTSTEALSFERVPEHLLVVGGGAVGLELGQAWANLGARVTVVEMLPQIVPFADKLAARLLNRALQDQGLEILTASKLVALEKGSGGLRVTVEGSAGSRQIECDRLLVAVGRRPATEELGLGQAGVSLDDTGRIEVDEHLRTSAGNVWAAGDLVPGPMLAHKAHEDGQVAVADMAGDEARTDYRLVPAVVYTHPELAQVGLTAEQCKQRGLKTSSGRFYFQASGRALAADDAQGVVQVLAEKDSGRIVGVQVVGPQASELVGLAVVALEAGLTAAQFARACQAHPTLAEALREAALSAAGTPLHG